MEIKSLDLICFSEVEITKRLVDHIATGANTKLDVLLDLSEFEPSKSISLTGDFVIISVPVTHGKCDQNTIDCISRLKGQNKPTVLILFFDRFLDDQSINTMIRTISASSFIPIALGAFCYSELATTNPLTEPALEDLQLMVKLGSQVRQKLNRTKQAEQLIPIDSVTITKFTDSTNQIFQTTVPFSETLTCTFCRECLSICPTAAISLDCGIITDPVACIFCCACIKGCPAKARTLNTKAFKPNKAAPSDTSLLKRSGAFYILQT